MQRIQQELPTTELPELKGQRAEVDSERRVRGHGNGLINKVLYFFAISFRGHRQWISYQGYNSDRHTQIHKTRRQGEALQRGVIQGHETHNKSSTG